MITCIHACDYLHRYSNDNDTARQHPDSQYADKNKNASTDPHMPKSNQEHERSSTSANTPSAVENITQPSTPKEDSTPAQVAVLV